VSEIQITDNQLFEIIGRSTVEIWSKDKELDAYRVSLETTKGLATEVNALRAAKPALETSNKQLSDQNIQLDKALTDARKEREAIRVELTQVTARADEATKNVTILTQSVEMGQKQVADLQFRLNELQASIATQEKKKSKK
jgi:chromosome segregation ATPase